MAIFSRDRQRQLTLAPLPTHQLSQSSRRQLSWDAERLAAAVALWQHQNTRFGGSSGSSNLLASAVLGFMSEIGEGSSEGPLRSFFRAKVQSLGSVVDHVTKEAKRLQASGEDWTAVLHEANAVLLLVFEAVSRFRSETGTLYGLDSSFLSVEPWTCRASLLDRLQWHFEATETLLRDRTRALGASAEASTFAAVEEAQNELRAQLAAVAGFAFSSFEERLLFLNT